MPQSDAPGEKTSATQPFPTKPPAFDRQGTSEADLIDFTPEIKAEAVKIASRYKMGPIFTPAVVSKWEGPLGTLMLPAPPSGHAYQLWLIKDSSPAPSVVMAAGARSGTAYLGALGGAQQVGVTLEPAAGSSRPTLPTVAEVSLA